VPTYHHHFSTDTPIDIAFDYLSRFSTTAEWDPGVVRSRDLTPGPVGLGSAFAVTASFLGREVPLRYEIVAFDPPGLVAVRAENGTVRSSDTMTFFADGDRTLVVYDAELDLRGAARVFTPLIAVAFRRIGDRAAAGLEAAVAGLPARASTEPGDHPAPGSRP
jgi:carbon monoxide dehydrogenase subunit G